MEAQGGVKTCNLIRGCGAIVKKDVKKEVNFWKDINIPFPSKSTRQRQKPDSIKESGVITSHLRNFQRMCVTSKPLQSNEAVVLRPICLSRDAMAIKPSGDFDIQTNSIIGLTNTIDLDYVKNNPIPDPEQLKRTMYTEAGAVVGTSLDNKVGLLLANDFLTSRTTSDMVFETLSTVIEKVQTCESCLRDVRSPLVDDLSKACTSICQACLLNIDAGQDDTCEECSPTYSSPFPQLRPCSRCTLAGIPCHKLAVVAVSMDCESNNACAMKRIHTRTDLPPHMQLLHAIPDAVHAGKKVFRSCANWWLLLDGYRINNSMLRTLRQFDTAASNKLRPVLTDSVLRNRDRMDYGAILECTDSKLHSVIDDLTAVHGTRMTSTLFPDPFWRSKYNGILSSATDICQG